MIIQFEDIIGTIMIFSALFIYIKQKQLGWNGTVIILFGTILIGLSSWKDINISIGKDGLNAHLNTIVNEVAEIKNNTNKLTTEIKKINLNLLREKINKIEITNEKFDKNKALEEINMSLKRSNIPKSYIFKKKCRDVLKYSEGYLLTERKYKEKKAEQFINICDKARKLNPNNFECTFLLAIAYHKNHNYKKTIQIIKELSKKNYNIAQRKLGIMYLFGDLIKQDISKGKFWLFKAAENGDKASQTIIDKGYLDIN